MIREIFLSVFISILSGCSLATIDTMHNEKLDPKVMPKKTRAMETISVQDLKDGIFIGIAMSGGGSRAANFSSAVLLELESLGILDKATAISSVSGSSLPAAYYGLYRADKTKWNRDEVRRRMIKDFESRWIGRWFLPQNMLLYWTTNFTRSDIMKETLDGNLFHDAAFGDMGADLPRILINATSIARGERFVFSEERFSTFGSRIDTYPVANAVMASSAFPGVFHDMTLIDHAAADPQAYKHLIDGGASDNLGTTTLLEMIVQLYGNKNKPKPKGCFLFVVDAYPYHKFSPYSHVADTRKFIDFFFDSNVAISSDALLSARRFDLMDVLNVDVRGLDIEPYQLNAKTKDVDARIWPEQDPYSDLQVECAVWHLSLQRMLVPDFAEKAANGDVGLKQRITTVAEVVNMIPTRYKLMGNMSEAQSGEETAIAAETLQEYLFDAAQYLIRLDKAGNGTTILDHVCEWFKKKGLKDVKCDHMP